MVKISWTDYALKDLADIGEYISKDSIKYAELVVDKLFQTPTLLETYPLAGRIVPEFNREHIRELISGNYRIVYRVVSDIRIDVLTVHACAKLLPKIDSFDDVK
jgi:toxin ParE1/3/4